MDVSRNENRKMNLDYALIQGFFWCAYCAVGSYAAFYLQASGFTGTATGLIMAAGSTLALLLPMVLSPIIDEGKRLTSTGAMLGTIALQFAAGIALLFLRGAGIVLGILYVIWMGLMRSMLPICTQICVDAEHCGCRVDYSTGRAFGSFAFIIASAILGKLLEDRPYTILPKAGLLLLVLLAAAVYGAEVLLRKRRDEASGEKEEKAPAKKGKSIAAFLKQYKDYGLLLLGLGLVFTGYGAVSEFSINIVEDLGGTAADVGYINAVYALLEIPAMLLWRRIASKKCADLVLALSICFFVGKTIFFAAMTSVAAIYPGAIFQFLGYGLFTPAIVAYTIKKIPYEDSAKAQSLAASMSTLGVILSSIFCGILLDRISVRQTMLLFSGVVAAGAVVCILAMIKMRKKGTAAKR